MADKPNGKTNSIEPLKRDANSRLMMRIEKLARSSPDHKVLVRMIDGATFELTSKDDDGTVTYRHRDHDLRK